MFPLYPHCLVALSFFFVAVAGPMCSITVHYPGQNSTAFGSYTGFYSHLLTQTDLFFLLTKVTEVYARNHRFCLGLVIRLGQSNILHLGIYVFFNDNQYFLLLCAFKIPSLKLQHVGVWVDGKQLQAERSLRHQHYITASDTCCYTGEASH